MSMHAQNIMATSGKRYEITMPKTGSSVTLIHCDALEMANVVPSKEYGTYIYTKYTHFQKRIIFI